MCNLSIKTNSNEFKNYEHFIRELLNCKYAFAWKTGKFIWNKENKLLSSQECTVIPNLRSNYAQGELLQETFSFRATISLHLIRVSYKCTICLWQNYFYAYISLSLFYLLICVSLWDALKKCKVLKIRIKHFYLEVWSLIALCSTSIYQETLRSLKEKLFWSSSNIIRVGQVPFPHLRKRALPFSVPSHLLVFCYGRGWCDVRILQQNHHDFPSSQYRHSTTCVAHYTHCATNKMLLMAAHPEIISNISWSSLSTEMWKVHMPFISSCSKAIIPYLK